MNKPKLKPCPHCSGKITARPFYEYEALQCDKCGMIFVLPQHGCGIELHNAFNRRTPPDNKALTVETRAGRIRAMSDEAMAKIIASNHLDEQLHFCQNRQACDEMLSSDEGIPEELCALCALDWLSQRAEED